MIRCFVGLGSNLQSPPQQLRQALQALQRIPRSRLGQCSPWYWNPSLSAGQPDYLNGAAELWTALEAAELLAHLQAIETAHGRERSQHWGPRTLDLDLLLYGEAQINLPQLCIPHPGITARAFVLQPLLDIDAALRLPDDTPLAAQLDDGAARALRRMPGSPQLEN